MSDRITQGDLLAAIDVVAQFVNECDELDVDDALAMREIIGQLVSEAKRADSMVTTTVMLHLEGGVRQIDERLYALKPAGKWRFRHDELAEAIRVRAVQSSLGAVAATDAPVAASEAARAAIALMAEAYVSPATTPKAELLAKLGFARRNQIADWERTGTEIVITDLSAPEGA